MRYDGTEHSSDVSSDECDDQLFALGAVRSWLGYDVPGGLIVSLIVFGFVGTYIGKITLNRLPEHVFRVVFKSVLTVMALKLFYGAISS